MMKLSGKRLFSLLLAIFMVITMLPPNIVFAEDEPPATICTGLADCPAETHEDGCPAKPTAEPPVETEPTKPACTGLADCPAETHKDGCRAKPASEPPVETEPTKPVCTGLADCPAETHGDSCEKKLADEKAAADKAAADAVSALIDALPTLEAVQAMPQEELPAAYEQVMKAHDAYKALTGDQKALLSIDETFFDGYLTYFASLTQPAADHSHTICGKTSCSCGSSHSATTWQPLTSGTTSLSGGTYYLDGDISLSSGLTVSGNVSLCLNGHTLTTTAGKIYISSGCLTICDCTGGGRITGASTNWSVIDLAGSGSLTVYSGTITSTDSSGTAISAYTTGDIQIRGGTVSAGRLALSLSKVNDLTVTSGSITSTSGYGISISQSFHDMKISGGTIKGFENGIHFDTFTCSGKVSISGGTIEATGTNVNAGGYASRLYGIGFSTGNAGTCYVYITGGTVKGAKGGIYNFNPNLTMNISGGTLGSTSTAGIESDRGTVNINGGKVYTVRCGGPATITVTNGEVYCVNLTAGAGSTGAGKLIVTGGTVGRVGSATSYYGIGNSLSNPTGTISVEISGGTVVGSSYALYSVSQFSAKISGGTFSGATADIHMGKAPASFSTAYISMDGYSGDPLTFSLGTTVKPVAYLARQVANSSLITLVDSTYSLNYDPATKSVILTDIHTHSFNSTTHKCSCGAIGGTCGIGLTWILEDGVLTISGTGAMTDWTSAYSAPWSDYRAQIKTLVVENGITSLGGYAFYGLSALTDVTIGTGVTAINNCAFEGCRSLVTITIPENVTTIGQRAFANCSGITSLTIPDSVTTIGSHALSGCLGLESLTIPFVGKELRTSADTYQYPFGFIFGENGLDGGVKTEQRYYGSSTSTTTATSYYIPASLKSVTVTGGNILTGAFMRCSNLTSITLPDGITTVGRWACYGCTGLTSMTVPAGVTEIVRDAFTGSSNLEKVYLPLSLTSVGQDAFTDSGLTDVYYAGTEAKWESVTVSTTGNTPLLNATMHYEYLCTSGHDYVDGTCTRCGGEEPGIGGYCGDPSVNSGKNVSWTLKDGVLTISGTGAMADYASASEPWYIYRNVITSAVVGEGVTTLGQAAFDECEKLQTVELPSTLTVIGKWAFSGCADLTAIDIPDSVHTIGAAAFGHCDMLTSVTIPAGVTEILGSTFYTCERLETVKLLGNITTIGDSAFGYCYKLKNFTIPSTVTSIGKYAFRSCWGLTGVTIPAGVTVVNYGTFHNCTNLVSVKLPSGLTKIDESAFESCGKLAEINLPSTLTTVGPEAFASCKQLESLVLPDSVTGIGKYAFSGCEKLTSVILPKNLASIPEGTFNFCPITEIEIPASVTSIATKAFGYCRSLTEITFLGNAPAFAADAFKEVANATALYPRTGTGWAEAVKSTYGGTVTWKMYCPNGQHSFEEIVDEAHLVSEATCAQGAVYKKLCPCGEVSATETFIYGEAGDHTRDKNHKCTLCGHIGGFCGIGSQNNGKNVSWTLKDGVLTISGTGAMDNYNSVTYKAPWDAYASEIVSVVVENGITSIGDSAFFRFGSLESVSIADTVTGIGSSAFSYCKELTDLKLPAGLLKIENDAFSNCEKLESVEIPAGVTSIGSVAFLNCEALTSVVIPGSVSSIGQAAFSSCTALEDAYYAGTKANWDEISIGSDNNRLLDTRIHYNCTNPAQHWTTHNTEATCTDAGYSVEVCVCPTPYNRNKVETATALGHDMGQWLPDPDKEGEERSDCSRCDHYETRPSGPVILLEDTELQNQTTVWIDGASYPVTADPDRKIVRVPENSNIKEGSALVTYEYHTGTAGDVHTQYPTGMKVWILSQQEDGNFTATRVSEFDNLLQYSGCSIRIVGVKGIRMITSINQSTKKALTGAGLAGYTLVEYGTALCRASALADGQPMTLENPNVKYNYAYKKGVADPVFKYSGNLVQYTNVLVGFTDDDCKDDIAMRPYIILQNESGDTVTIYGGIIYRSIGYIAYQNRNAFAVGSDAYEYVWSIIHHVYGDEFDADYKS